MQVGFIGAGNMAQAIIDGLIANDIVSRESIIVNARTQESLKMIEDKYGIRTTMHKDDVLRLSDVIVLACKPKNMEELIEELKVEIKNEYDNRIFISIAAGISIEQLEKYFDDDDDDDDFVFIDEAEKTCSYKIVRAMPNMPSAVGAGMTGVAINKNVKFADIDRIVRFFGSFGKVEILGEEYMDAVVALSGSSPAYIYMIIDAMVKVAEAEGMKKEMALKFAAQAVLGSARMVLESDKSPQQLIKEVCSPGGTTLEAISVLEKEGLSDTISKAMKACIEKSKNING